MVQTTHGMDSTENHSQDFNIVRYLVDVTHERSFAHDNELAQHPDAALFDLPTTQQILGLFLNVGLAGVEKVLQTRELGLRKMHQENYHQNCFPTRQITAGFCFSKTDPALRPRTSGAFPRFFPLFPAFSA